MEDAKIREAVIYAFIVALEAQLRALKRMQQEPMEKIKRKRVGMSQVDMVEDILKVSGESLHISDIIDRVEKSQGVCIERESIVSALTKKVAQKDRFVRTDKNTFGLKGGN
jgi:DNA-directed RNA polymerase delta subunit